MTDDNMSVFSRNESKSTLSILLSVNFVSGLAMFDYIYIYSKTDGLICACAPSRLIPCSGDQHLFFSHRDDHSFKRVSSRSDLSAYKYTDNLAYFTHFNMDQRRVHNLQGSITDLKLDQDFIIESLLHLESLTMALLAESRADVRDGIHEDIYHELQSLLCRTDNMKPLLQHMERSLNRLTPQTGTDERPPKKRKVKETVSETHVSVSNGKRSRKEIRRDTEYIED